MSILLEALRKSEKGQRSREVPTIHTEVPSESSSEPQWTLPVVLLIVIALIICGWFVWHQYWVPSDDVGVADKATAEAGNSAPSVQAPEPTGQKKAKQAAADDTNVTGANSASANSADRPSAQKSGRPRTPTESYQPPPDNAANSSAPGGTQKTAPGKAGQTKSKARAAPDTKNAADAGAAKAQSKPKQLAAETPPKQEYRPQKPQPIGYWELPDSVREVIPVIKFSVLVYDKNPPNRFVLINGERLGEGDSFQQGVEVKEIRRDGVIFSYRLYQFLVEK